MKAKHKTCRKRPFTLVELMIAAVSGTILVLTGAMLLYIMFVSWTHLTQDVEVQRDAKTAMDYLHKTLREADANDISVINGTLYIDVGDHTEAFYVVGRTLYHDPNTNENGDEKSVIIDKVDVFQVVQDRNPDMVGVRLELSDDDAGTEMVTVVAQRN